MLIRVEREIFVNNEKLKISNDVLDSFLKAEKIEYIKTSDKNILVKDEELRLGGDCRRLDLADGRTLVLKSFHYKEGLLFSISKNQAVNLFIKVKFTPLK